MAPPLATVDDLMALLARCAQATDSIVGGDQMVSILDHGLQCAAVLADQAPDDEELHVAGLVHDVGHVVAPGDADGHGRHGCAAVAPLLGERVAGLVDLHVPAKRYLVTTDPAYAAQLSDGSTHTLELQGGRLDAAEVARLEADPLFPDALTLRRADEAAKVPDAVVSDLESWRSVLDQVAADQR